MIPLLGLCLLVMAVLHWVLEPLETLFTWTLQLKLLPWLLGLIVIWLFAGVTDRNQSSYSSQAG